MSDSIQLKLTPSGLAKLGELKEGTTVKGSWDLSFKSTLTGGSWSAKPYLRPASLTLRSPGGIHKVVLDNEGAEAVPLPKGITIPA